MLALTIKVGEKVHIGDDITVSVGFVRDNNDVRLRFEAPHDIKILREKIYNQQQEEHALHGTGESQEQTA